NRNPQESDSNPGTAKGGRQRQARTEAGGSGRDQESRGRLSGYHQTNGNQAGRADRTATEIRDRRKTAGRAKGRQGDRRENSSGSLLRMEATRAQTRVQLQGHPERGPETSHVR